MIDKRVQLTEGPIAGTLTKLTLPMIVGFISIMLFHVVDAIFVGQLGGNELAALSFTFPVFFLLLNIAIGLGIGALSVISHSIGESGFERVQALTTGALLLTVLVFGCIAVIGYATIDPLFHLLGANGGTLVHVRAYISLIYIFCPFFALPIVANNSVRAAGDTLGASSVMLLGSVLNAVFDPIFIFGYFGLPAMGIRGAAVATVTSWIITFFFSLWILIKRHRMLCWPQRSWIFQAWKNILRIALPAGLNNTMLPISTGIITAFAASHGPEVVAAYGVGGRIESLSLVLIFALATALSPFIGQNFGAHKMYRVRKAVQLAVVFTIVWEAALCLILVGFSPHIARLFTKEPAVARLITQLLYIVPFSYGLHGIVTLTSSTFYVLRKPGYATGLNTLRLFILALPLAYFGAQRYGPLGIFLGVAAANGISGFVALYLLYRDPLIHGR